MSENVVKVWDPLVRVFHWSLVVFFVIAYFTGEEENDLHIYSGYAVLGLVLFRVIWGLVGSRHARFSDFVYSPASVIAYLKSLLSKNPKHFLGHNPAGGYMVILLLVMLLITSLTGLKVYGLEGHGPLAGSADIVLISAAVADDDEDDSGGHEEGSEDAEEWWEKIHEVASNLTVLLILLHVVGVIVSGKLHKENLVKAMITGKKHLQN